MRLIEITTRGPGAWSSAQDSASVGPALVLSNERVAMTAPLGRGDLDLMEIAVRVGADDGVDDFCEQGHRPGCPF